MHESREGNQECLRQPVGCLPASQPDGRRLPVLHTGRAQLLGTGQCPSQLLAGLVGIAQQGKEDVESIKRVILQLETLQAD